MFLKRQNLIENYRVKYGYETKAFA